MTDEKRIAELMRKLDLTREEVLEMLAEDEAVEKAADGISLADLNVLDVEEPK